MKVYCGHLVDEKRDHSCQSFGGGKYVLDGWMF